MNHVPGPRRQYLRIREKCGEEHTTIFSNSVTNKTVFSFDYYGCTITDFSHFPGDESCALTLVYNTKECECPICDKASTIRNSYTPHYAVGTPAPDPDNPRMKLISYICVMQPRFFCDNESCPGRKVDEETGKVTRLTFTASPPFLLPYARVVDQVAATGIMTGIVASFRTAESLMYSLRMPFSRFQSSKVVSKTKITFGGKCAILGMDEVYISFLGGFYTVIYDFFSHKRIAVFRGKSSVELDMWLEEHKAEIIAICRDRGSSYGSAIETHCRADCVQIADKFHLIANNVESVWRKARWILPEEGIYISVVTDENNNKSYELLAEKPELDRRLPDYSDNYPGYVPSTSAIIDSDGNPIPINIGPTGKERTDALKKAEKKIDDALSKYYEIQQIVENLRSKGIQPTIRRVASKSRFSEGTVKKYMDLTEESIRGSVDYTTFLKSAEYHPIVNLIYRLMDKNYTNPVIYCFIKSVKDLFNGSDAELELLINRIGINHFERKAFRISACKDYVLPPDILHFSRKAIVCFLCITNPKTKKNPVLEAIMPQLMEKYKDLYKLHKAAQDFAALFHDKDVDKLNAYIQEYSNVLPSFCTGLVNDRKAIEHAIILGDLFNSSFVEGDNNGYKTVKRIGCGAYGLEMTFNKLGFWECRKEIDPYDLLITGEHYIPAPPEDHPAFKRLEALRAG